MEELKNIRLLQLMKKLDIGGVERSTVEYSNHLVHEFGWIGIFASNGENCREYSINPAICVIPSRFKPELLIFFPATFMQIFFSLTRYRINIIHYHHRIFLPYIFLIRVFFPNIKILYTHHSCFRDQKTKFLLADQAICPSTGTAEDFRASNLCPLVMIPHGVYLADPAPQWKPGEFKHIGYVGRFEKEKGLMTLLDAFITLNREDPMYQLVLRGDGTLRATLERVIHQNGLSGCVRFEGPFNDLDKLYKNIHIVVLPSYSLEGFGITILEGIARSIPVVATKIAGITDIIRNGIDGSLVPPHDPKALHIAIETMFNDTKYRENCISESRKRIQTLFSTDITVQRYKDCLLSLYSAPG